MSNSVFIITIDGPTASGKGTLASKIAAKMGFDYMDTGALYRGVAKTALDQGLDPSIADDAIKAAKLLHKQYDLSLQDDPAIRTEAVSKGASEVAAVQAVRDILLDLQKNFSKHGQTDEACVGVVMEGRDIGTVICPDADVKFFIDANADVRAKRRFKQLHDKGVDADYDEILKQLHIRDGRDIGRSIAPTVPADNAVILETSKMDAKQVLETALKIIVSKYTPQY
ncbi:MAG: (d)CMP kinase [Alphaproteobacteria bacterium]|nr:(d)CMP kinase [Alphaproteobacteria bacterium]